MNLKKEVIVVARTANIYTRVDPVVKEQAEEILDQLGIPMSNAIGMFLRQVVMHNGIPFDMKLPLRRPMVRVCVASSQRKGISENAPCS